ncbi:MAG: hypothetical protein CMI29_01570 [Opitutae bacterium]|nr:hypothetical protein [Opitutae bacterium]
MQPPANQCRGVVLGVDGRCHRSRAQDGKDNEANDAEGDEHPFKEASGVCIFIHRATHLAPVAIPLAVARQRDPIFKRCVGTQACKGELVRSDGHGPNAPLPSLLVVAGDRLN